MQDGIIAGNGNSRYLKTVAAALSLYPDYESFMAALIAGTFPIDLNGINAGGWTQQGTPLNKANLFSDSTAITLGLSAANSPNDALVKIKTLIDSVNTNANGRAIIDTGYYIGDGTNTVSKTFTTPVKLFCMYCRTYEGKTYSTDLLVDPSISGAYRWTTIGVFGDCTVSWSNGNKTVTLSGPPIAKSGDVNHYFVVR